MYSNEWYVVYIVRLLYECKIVMKGTKVPSSWHLGFSNTHGEKASTYNNIRKCIYVHCVDHYIARLSLGTFLCSLLAEAARGCTKRYNLLLHTCPTFLLLMPP